MIYLAYCSAATKPFSGDDLVALLRKCRMNNLRDGITGMLLYRDGSFMQVLEGETAAVLETFARIAHDSRHGNIVTLAQADIQERSFDRWSMGFRDVSALSAGELDAFSTFLIEQFDAEHYASEGKALELLRMFPQLVA